MPAVVNLIIVGLILFMAYILTSEGLWGSALMCMNIMFAGIIAFNFYEPLARLLASNMSLLAGHADSICMMVIFIATLLILRLTTDSIAPQMVRFPSALYQLGRLFFGFAGSVMVIAIILLSFEASAIHKKVFTIIDYKFKPPFGMGIDHEWLAFFQWTTGAVFPDLRGPNDSEYPRAKIFDPRGEWLLNHQDARPFGEESVLATEESSGGSAESAPSADAGGGDKKPGDPTVIGSGGSTVVIPGNN